MTPGTMTPSAGPPRSGTTLLHALRQLRFRPFFPAGAAGVLAAGEAAGAALVLAARYELLLLLRQRQAALRSVADPLVLRRADRRLDAHGLLRRAHDRGLADA